MGISTLQALDCLRSTDLIGIGMEADAVRRTLHPENVVTYAVDGVVLTADCPPSEVEISGAASIRLTETRGLTFAQLEATLAATRSLSPSIAIHGPSGGAISGMAKASGLSTSDAVARLRDAGLSSFSGHDLEVGGESQQLLDLHRCAHRAGIQTTAGMVFGAGESVTQRLEHLFALRQLQEETGGFIAFSLHSFLPAAASREVPTAVEYMRTMAVARMVLDNIQNIEADCATFNLKVVQMALRFGANDTGALPPHSEATFTEEDLRRVIRDAGFTPVERDSLYRTFFLNN